VIGRGFTEGDGEPGATPVVMLGHEYWRKRFAADPTVVGRSIRVDDAEYTVVGVTRPDFMLVQTVKLFFPLPERKIPNPTMMVNVVAKVAPGVRRASLAAELETIVVRDPSLVAIVEDHGGDPTAIKVSTWDIDWLAQEWSREAFRPAIGSRLEPRGRG
jgi:hypothetical protein